MESKVDPFGFKGQAQDYDIERPRYPSQLTDELIQKSSGFSNYIDIASGTGLLFYELAQKFNGSLVVNDRSKKQLQVAKEKLKNYTLNPENVEFVESDAFDISNHLKKPIKFDLVTIAQAFHWVDPDKFCQYVINDILSENGKFAILGYFCDGFDYNFPEDIDFSRSGQKHYDKFYSIVLPHFDCDRESLDKGHSNFDFTKYFGSVERNSTNQTMEISLERFSKYLGTYSAYNIYKDKFGKNADFEDPLETFKKNVQNDFDTYYQKHKLQVKEKPLVMRLHFFMVLLSQAKKIL
jgi:SAM-dependent methyltransferase